MTLSWHHIGKANMVNDEKGYLKNQAPLCIIYLESESDVNPICPQLNYDYLKEINILNFGRWGCLFLFVKMIVYVGQSRENY